MLKPLNVGISCKSFEKRLLQMLASSLQKALWTGSMPELEQYQATETALGIRCCSSGCGKPNATIPGKHHHGDPTHPNFK
jgi:hypothetical protein